MTYLLRKVILLIDKGLPSKDQNNFEVQSRVQLQQTTYERTTGTIALMEKIINSLNFNCFRCKMLYTAHFLKPVFFVCLIERNDKNSP